MKRHCPVCITVYDDRHCEFFCPHNPRAGSTTCRFCGEPAAAECKWPVERFKTVRYSELKVGDRIKRLIEFGSLAQRAPAEVVDIQKTQREGFIDAVGIVMSIKGRLKTAVERGHGLCVRLESQSCRTSVCENHLREVGEGRGYCADHWHAWEAVA